MNTHEKKARRLWRWWLLSLLAEGILAIIYVIKIGSYSPDPTGRYALVVLTSVVCYYLPLLILIRRSAMLAQLSGLCKITSFLIVFFSLWTLAMLITTVIL